MKTRQKGSPHSRASEHKRPTEEIKTDWFKEIEYEDLLDKDALLIYEHCGPEVLFKLWENLPGINFYLSEKSLFKIKRRYIRKYYCKDDPFRNAKALAARLGVSERFVYDALSETDVTEQEKI